VAKIDVTQEIVGLNGEPIRQGRALCGRCGKAVMACPNCDGDTPVAMEALTLQEVCRFALANTLPGDDKLAGDTKFEHFHLALRIVDNNEVELKAEEISTIKERIGKVWSTMVMGRAWEMLDPT